MRSHLVGNTIGFDLNRKPSRVDCPGQNLHVFLDCPQAHAPSTNTHECQVFFHSQLSLNWGTCNKQVQQVPAKFPEIQQPVGNEFDKDLG